MAERGKGHKNWEKSPIYQDVIREMPEGYNTQKIRFIQQIIPTEKLDPNDLEEMERRFQRYLDLCAEYDQKIGNQAAYMAIGIDKGTAFDWANRNQSNPARSDFIKKVQRICGVYREGLMEDGQINNITGIFWQKNYDGMKDQQELVVTPNQNPLGDGESAERLAEKYLDQTKGIEQKDIIDLPIPEREQKRET